MILELGLETIEIIWARRIGLLHLITFSSIVNNCFLVVDGHKMYASILSQANDSF